jgi:uncharacterized protein involved in exopolysaccharide biosynthesis/Mrp family chromosome partitioning ATPase
MFAIDAGQNRMFAVDAKGSADNGRAQQQPADSGGLSLYQLIGAIFRCKLLIVLGALIGAALALVIALTTPHRFVSTAQILIDPRDLRVLQNEVTPSSVLNDSTTAFLESQARVIASDKIKIRVIEQEKLTEDPEFGADSDAGDSVTEALRKLIGAPKAQRTGDAMVLALEAMDKRVVVKRNERTFVIDINVATRDAQKSARIANALAATYFKDQIEIRSDATRRASTSLTSRLTEMRDRLRDAEEKVQQFKSVNDIASVGNRSVNEEQMTQASALLAGTRNRVADSKARFDQLAQLSPARLETGSLPEALSSNTITALRAQLGAALAREADLVTLLGPSHPQMIAVRSQVRDARKQIAEELARIVQSARLDYERAIGAERSLVQRFGDLKRDSFATNQASVQLRELEREAEATRSVYQAFLQRAREATELVGIDVSNARVISDAMPSSRPSGVSRRLIVIGGTVAGGALGLLLGLTMIWGRNAARMNASAVRAGPAAALDPQPASSAATPRQFRRVVEPAAQIPEAQVPEAQAAEAQSPDVQSSATQSSTTQADAPSMAALAPEIRAKQPAGLPDWTRSLATGPFWKRTEERSAAKPSSMAEAEANVIIAGWKILARTPRAEPTPHMNDAGAITSVFQDRGFPVDSFEAPSSAFSRSIDALAAAIGPASSSGSRRILVLGLAPGAGSSTVALNLALGAARADDVPLLIDLGRGARTLTDALVPELGLGFDDVYNGSAGLVRAVLQDEETSVFFLPREKGRMLKAEDVDARHIRTKLMPMLRRFDPVIIDGAAAGRDPLLATLAAEVDDIILVARPGDVTAETVAQMKGAFDAAANGRIRGVVINDI